MKWLSAFCLFCVALAGCEWRHDQLPELKLSGPTMGTQFNVTLVALPHDIDGAALQTRIDDRLAHIEQLMSTFDSNSELSKFNQSKSTEWHDVSSELCTAIAQALSISQLTGAFDITVGPLVNLWGFGPSDAPPEPPDAAAIEKKLQDTGFGLVHSDCQRPAIKKDRIGVYVDLSAYAKGYAVDQIVALLAEYDLENFLVEIGGELRMQGHNADRKSWSIAIEKPVDFSSEVQTIVQLTNVAFATSGDYRNFYVFAGQRFSHTIDPQTGYPVTHDTAAVSVISDTAAFADAMATALMVLGIDDGLALAEREGIAAYFLLRTDSGIEEYATQAFADATGLQL